MSQSNLTSLFAGAQPMLGAEATEALNLAAADLGDNIMAGMGTVDIDDIDTTEVLLVSLVIDDSSSITFTKRDGTDNVQHVIDGHNTVLDELARSKEADAILISCEFLNTERLYPFVQLPNAIRMDDQNYRPHGGTPLYERAKSQLATVVAKVESFRQAGVKVRSATYFITDGGDNTYMSPTSVAPIIEAMIRTENHIIGGVGIDDGSTNFRDIFRQMGIPDRWILTPGNTASEIRAAFGTVSRSAVQASKSQAAGTFSQTALGGFGGN